MRGFKKRGLIVILQFFLIVSFLPVLLGQGGCEIPQDLVDTIKQLLNQKIKPAVGQRVVYVTQLSFIDAYTRTMMGNSEESELINDAVLNGIRQAEKLEPKLKFNESGHMIKNTDSNVNKLTDLIFDPNSTPNDRINKIINQMMSPNQVDVIMTGNYVDRKDEIIVKPLAVVKESRKVMAKTLSFGKQEYICRDPANPNKKALCKNTYEEIARAVKELLLAL